MRRIVFALAVVMFVLGGFCQANWSLTDDFNKGWWRAEINGSTGLVGEQVPEESDDYLVIGSLEYEWPMDTGTTLAIRSYPVFVYNINDQSANGTNETVYGAALGLALRFYQNSGSYTGWFGEFGGSVLAHSDYFPGNGSKCNFISNIGLGYQFENNWNLAGRLYHISNGGVDDQNNGINVLALSAGTRF